MISNYLLKSFQILFLVTALSCVTESEPYNPVDRNQLLGDIEYLSSDEMEGRLTGTEGNRMARNYIAERYSTLGLSMFDDRYEHLFDHTNRGSEDVIEAVNLIGFVEGSSNPERYIVMTAHYDHLGVRDGEIYNGTDDNASGTAGLMAAARYFTDNQPENSIIFIALDAEEQGLSGARHFVDNPVVPLDQIVMNINMDMISNNFENELYAVGTYHYPFLKPMIEDYTEGASVNVLFGYDSDDWEQDWTFASDHGPFHSKGIPFVYFGVEDHEHYHAPSDIYENTNPEFYVNAVETILNVVDGLDGRLDEVVEESNRTANQ